MNKSVKGTLTEANLLKSFAGESQAKNRYTFFSEVAKKEGAVYDVYSALQGTGVPLIADGGLRYSGDIVKIGRAHV